MALPGTDGIRFRRPTAGPNAVAARKKQEEDEIEPDMFGGKHAPVAAWKKRHQGLLQDQVGRANAGPFIPSFSLALRLLLLVRVSAAMYSNIADCDEVFNFFEPLHYFTRNSGFQTWELSPEYAVRSWAYILLHWPMAELAPWLFGIDKRAAFFCIRISLGVISSLCEAKFYRAVAEGINERVGRYMLAMLLVSCGMWNAGVAFLPSSFAMYTTMLAYSYWLVPLSTTRSGKRRVFLATFAFAVGALLGWPFSILLSAPFLFEWLNCFAGEVVADQEKWVAWRIERVGILLEAGLLAALVAIPIVLVDSYAYGRLVFPSLNILLYNVSSSSASQLYGTEPWYYYLLNLTLHFNILLPLALLSGPALIITYFYDFRRLGQSQQKPKAGETSPYLMMATRLSAFYLWLVVFSLQAHKEERFMSPAYPLLGLNAAVTVYLIKGWAEKVYIKMTASPYQAAQSRIFPNISLAIIFSAMAISVSRVFALGFYYHAPLDLAYHFQYTEVPRLLTLAGHKPTPPPKEYAKSNVDEGYNPEWNYTKLYELEPRVTVCLGSRWYEYPGSYLFPSGVEVYLVKSEFDGAAPKKWIPSEGTAPGMWPREETRVVRDGRFNGLNEASDGTYVDESACSYMIDLTTTSHSHSALEPSYISDTEHWEQVYCAPYLDSSASKWWTRLVWVPGEWAEQGREWGDYCLLRRKRNEGDV